MKYLKIFFISILTLIIITGIWICEPTSINIFKHTNDSFAESEVLINNSTSQTIQNQLKVQADSILDNAMLLNDFIGISSGVYKKDIGTYLGSAGYKNKFSQEEPNNQTRYRTASIAKSITAVAMMQLWEKKLIELDVAIQTYLPEFPSKPEGEITIRQLLKHTSGIKHYSSMWDGISFTHYENLVDALNEFKNRPLSFIPGTGYEYTTYGYTILGAILEKVTKQSYQDYMKANIFLPSNMHHTDVEDAKESYENKASLYIKLGNSYIKSPKTDLSVKVPGGGFQTTAKDLLNFGKAVLENKLIDSTTLEMMMSNTDTLKQGTPYGFGWFVIDDEKNGRILQHGGSQSGCSSFFQILLDKKIVVATLANNFGSDEGVYWLSRDLTNLILSEDLAQTSIDYYVAQSTDILDQYVGKYQYKDGVFNISRKGNRLFSQTKHYPALPIFPKSTTEFFFRHFGGEYRFSKLEDGMIELAYKNNGEQTIANKLD